MRTGGIDNGAQMCDPIVIGGGWLGTEIAKAVDVPPVPRRHFGAGHVEGHPVVFVASGRAAFSADERLADVLRAELHHLRQVLDACERAGASRIVVLGSSDVTGLAAEVTSRTPQAPLTKYAEVKAALEDECVLRASAGVPVTTVRLAPVHGAGKQRTAHLVRLARLSLIPLPGGGRHSIGFVLLADAVRALVQVGGGPANPVLSVGGGPTPLGELLQHLGAAQGKEVRRLPVPAPGGALAWMGSALPLPPSAHWLLRLSLPRAVTMEPPAEVTPLPEAAAMLVASC